MASFRGDKAFLSNFFPSVIYYDGHAYPTVEHAFVAAKTLDLSERQDVRACATPGQAKRLGRTLTLRPDWDDIKINIMRELVFQKFNYYWDLKAKLLKIVEPIVELNEWHDNFWGSCTCEGCADKEKHNNLGKILTFIRNSFLLSS
jgi:ribA/ribD-fused uncharacterized protein